MARRRAPHLVGALNLLVATSCLQGRPLLDACLELSTLPVQGLQLCPGNAPPDPAAWATWRAAVTGIVRTHQGFTPHALRCAVWSPDHDLLHRCDSVHPPRSAGRWWLPDRWDAPTCLEVMYGTQPLGTGDAVVRAMERGLPLAVDVSHVFLQLAQGAMTDAVWRRLQDYPRIDELHVSSNDGRRDAHGPVTADTFGLDWVRERARDSTVVVLESYWHRTPDDARRRQLALVRG